jgi:hypothetical protein
MLGLPYIFNVTRRNMSIYDVDTKLDELDEGERAFVEAAIALAQKELGLQKIMITEIKEAYAYQNNGMIHWSINAPKCVARGLIPLWCS